MKKIDLGDPRPVFLLQLDSDRNRAISDFRRYVDRFFQQAPPNAYFRVPPDERDDVVSEVVLHCIDNDCAKLRKFQPREGSTFAGWLAVVTSRKISDLAKQKKNLKVFVPADEGHDVSSPAPSPEQIAIKNEIEGIFLGALRRLSRRCRLLLRLRILEYKNREIVKLMRLSKEHNKTIGNQVIECRRKLVRFLREDGYFGVSGTKSG